MSRSIISNGSSSDEKLSFSPSSPRISGDVDEAGLFLGGDGFVLVCQNFIFGRGGFIFAVQIACDELGIAPSSNVELSLTGGLPYFGGPGNTYSLHGIAHMADRLRANPGEFGLVNANGWYLTKHSLGIYSTNPAVNKSYEMSPIEEMASEQKVKTTENPSGKGVIETYTVSFDKSGAPSKGIIIGRDENGQRFLANTRSDTSMLNEICEKDGAIGRSGTIARKGKLNLFTLD